MVVRHSRPSIIASRVVEALVSKMYSLIRLSRKQELARIEKKKKKTEKISHSD